MPKRCCARYSHEPPGRSQGECRSAAARGAAMSRVDDRGCRITGATASAGVAYERALAAFQSWRGGVDAELALALRESPDFVMAHALQAYLLIGSRDPRRVQSARPVHARAAGLPAN